MKAVVLAAGEGTRLEPLTDVRPKPMLPVANRPMLEYVIDAVADAGLDEIILVVGYHRERIQSHFGNGDQWDVEISYVVQDPQLGTGDALLQAESHVGSDFVVLNGDQIIESAIIDAVRSKREQSGNAVLAATHTDRTQHYGVVSVDGDRMTNIQEKPSVGETDAELVNLGVYAFGPEVFSAIRETETVGELGLPETLRQHQTEHPVSVLTYEGLWLDVTYPWDLLTVNGRILDSPTIFASDRCDEEPAGVGGRRLHEDASVVESVACGPDLTVGPNATVLRGTALGRNVSIGPNAVVENSVVMADATIGAGAVVRDCVVGANAHLGPATTVEGGETDVEVNGTIHRAVRLGGVIGDNATLNGRVTVVPGTRVGGDCAVETGAILDGTFEAGATVRRG